MTTLTPNEAMVQLIDQVVEQLVPKPLKTKAHLKEAEEALLEVFREHLTKLGKLPKPSRCPYIEHFSKSFKTYTMVHVYWDFEYARSFCQYHITPCKTEDELIDWIIEKCKTEEDLKLKSFGGSTSLSFNDFERLVGHEIKYSLSKEEEDALCTEIREKAKEDPTEFFASMREVNDGQNAFVKNGMDDRVVDKWLEKIYDKMCDYEVEKYY